MCVNGGIDEWFPIQYRGKQSGQIHLKGQWTPSPAQAPQANLGAQAYNQAVGQFGQMQGVMGIQPMQPQPMMYAQPMMQQPMMGQQPVMGM